MSEARTKKSATERREEARECLYVSTVCEMARPLIAHQMSEVADVLCRLARDLVLKAEAAAMLAGNRTSESARKVRRAADEYAATAGVLQHMVDCLTKAAIWVDLPPGQSLQMHGRMQTILRALHGTPRTHFPVNAQTLSPPDETPHVPET